MGTEQQTDIKRTLKSASEWETIYSDRISLVDQANRFVDQITARDAAAKQSLAGQLELTDQEGRTYNAALEYLERQFRLGHREPESTRKRVESERSIGG